MNTILSFSSIQVVLALAMLFCGTWRRVGAQTAPEGISAEDVQRIQQALPSQAPAVPKKARMLLIFDSNVNYGGHGSIRYANYAFAAMGLKTGAFKTVVSHDPAVFRPESLRQYDAVFFNNNVGNLFTDPALRESLAQFVYAGGGLMGVHGTAVAFTQWPGGTEDWPEFGLMIGGRGANHRDADEPVFMKLDDLTHPVNRAFDGKGFLFRDEFFRVHEPYSRDKLRVLLSMDNSKTDVNQGQARGSCYRADNDYGVAWVRGHGRGRTFYCTIAHNPYVFWDPVMLQFYLGAAQFVLGDLDGGVIPSAHLTPALVAQEKIGWRVGLASIASAQTTLFNAAEQAQKMGLAYLTASSSQAVGKGVSKTATQELNADEFRQLRLGLDGVGVRLLVLDGGVLPKDQTKCREVFASARRLGADVVACDLKGLDLSAVEKCAVEFDLKVALCGKPSRVAKALTKRDDRMGAMADVTAWLKDGINPVKALNTLRGRVVTVRLSSVNQQEVKIEASLRALRESSAKPVIITLESGSGDERHTVEYLNQLSLRLAGQTPEK